MQLLFLDKTLAVDSKNDFKVIFQLVFVVLINYFNLWKQLDAQQAIAMY